LTARHAVNVFGRTRLARLLLGGLGLFATSETLLELGNGLALVSDVEQQRR
jgi:hypothetical protein